jgi:ABC-type multidrug transport system ATPase subunit
MRNPILQAYGLTFKFPQQQVFSSFSASVPAGITYVVGGESCGKSTLLRLFAGDLTPQSGNIAIFNSGQAINRVDNLAQYKKYVFWVDPRTSLHDQITPNDYFDSQRNDYSAFDNALLLEMIEGLSLKDHVSKAMYMLSAGSKRKVWLAAAFASGAKVTLLDEPFAALDKASINFLIERLESFKQGSERAWVIADYEVPQNLTVNLTINLAL